MRKHYPPPPPLLLLLLLLLLPMCGDRLRSNPNSHPFLLPLPGT